MIRGNAGKYTLAVLLNDERSTNQNTGDRSVTSVVQVSGTDAIVTLNVFQSLRWSKGTVITLEVTSDAGPVTVLKSSSWSMSFIGEQTGTFKEFAAFGTDDIEVLPGTPSRINFDALKMNLPTVEESLKDTSKSTKGQFISPTGLQLNELSKFELANSDLFYVSATIHVTGEATDIEAVITVSEEETNDFLGQKGISGRFNKIANADGSISLAGVLFAQKRQFVSVYLGAADTRKFNITKDSFVSIINMRYIVSSVGAKLSTDEVISSNNWVAIQQNWEVQSSDSGLYAFGKDFDKTVGVFRASHSGIHIIHANIHFQVPSTVIDNANNRIYATLVIDDNLDEGKNGFYSLIEKPKSLSSLRVYGVVDLRAGQDVSIRVKSDSASTTDPYRVTKRTSLTISYIGPKWAVPGFFALIQNDRAYSSTSKPSEPFNQWLTTKGDANTPFITDSSMFDGTYFTSPEDAVYAITASIIVTNPSCQASTYFTMKLVTTGIGGTNPNEDIGMSDQKYVLGSSERSITLTFSTAIRLKLGEKAAILFQEEFDGSSKCQYTVSGKSSFSVIRWSDYSNPAWNLKQNLGFYARTTSAIAGTTGKWERLGTSVLKTDTVQARAGIYEISGDGFTSGNAAYAVQAPAIFFVSGSIRLRGSVDSILNGVYEISLEVDGEEGNSGLYAQIKESGSNDIVLTFAGTLYLNTFQVVRIIVKGSGDQTYFIDRLSSFAMIKLQPDYKTPGIITEDSQTISSTGTQVALTEWNALNKLGLTLR